MKNKNFVRILCLILTAALILGLFIGAVATIASAATTSYSLPTLLSEGKIKALGRTQVNAAGDGITADWSGSGFDINVSGSGGTMTVGYKASYAAYWAVLVDGTQIWRAQASSSANGTFSVTIPSGFHTVRVVKETQINSSTSSYWDLTTLSFGGTIEAAPAQKDLYIEFIGDSITCGDGALGEYEPGVKWLGSHDSATNGYAYYAAQKLDADYSLVARGGIGLFTGISEAEGTPQKAGMQDVYDYVSGYNQANGTYDFARQPDVIVIELGANDSISSSDQYTTIEYWTSLMESFIDQVRAKNPNAQIVLHSTNATKFKALMGIVESRESSDPKLHAFYYSYLGNGSAALATQYAGHPSADDHAHFADALVSFLQTEDLVPGPVYPDYYSDIAYYVSENGSDSNSGKSIDDAKLTLQAAIDQARTDNTFAPLSRVVIYVQGTVKSNANNKQGIATGTLKDSSGSKVPILVTTYNYSGTKAVLNSGHAAVNDGNGSLVFYNDVTLKDIVFQSTTNASTGYRDRNLYSGYNHVVFDNVTFDMNGDTPKNNSGWRISCGTAFGSDALPTEMTASSITFKNGDYTNLDFATAVMSNGIWKSSTETIYDVPYGDFRLVIEDGAQMGTVYNRYGNLNVGASSVTIYGGSIQQYVGTADGSSSAQKVYKGDITLTVGGGHIYGTHFSTAGKYVTVEGDINTTICGGIFTITPKSTTDQYDAYFFGGRQKCIVNNINTTISGGQFYLVYDVAGVDSAYYFGVSGGGSVTNVTNKISGGTFMPIKGDATPGHASIYFGVHTGTITGTLRNEISGGNFVLGSSGISPAFVFGSRGVNQATGKVENVIGTEGSTHGPVFSGGTTYLGGNWAQIGVSSKQSAQPTAADCSDTVVISNTIYGGSFSTLHLSATSGADTSKGYYSFVKGSVESNIYGGFFQGSVYGGGNTQLYGKATTNIYGGFFKSIYGASYSGNRVFDGVELNIFGLDEYYPVASNKWVISGGSENGSVPVPQTEGRPAIKLTVAPEKASGLVLNTPLKVGTTSGTTSASVSAGTFPQGFAVEGKTVGEALASGCAVFDTTTGAKASYAASDASVPGAVAVDTDGDTYVNELVYYVSENGQDAYSGTSAVTPKKTLRAVFSEVIADNGGSYKFPAGTTLTIYVEGTVNNDAGTGAQQIGGGQVLITGSDLHDHVPVTITTYNYNGKDKAVVVDNHYAVNGGNASAYVVNDLCFKDIDLMSITNPNTGYCDNNLYAAGCAITFDNCSITTDGKATKNANTWKINADHFATGGFNPLKDSFLPLYGSVTFRNGDYTNLERVAAVGANSIWQSSGSVYSIPKMYCSIIIEDGAQMGTVYNSYGTLGVGSATVEVRGGTVEKLIGTQSGYLDGDKDVTFTYNTAQISNIISGGTVKEFLPTGAGYYNTTSKTDIYVTINGNVTNTVSGGTVEGTQFFGLNNYVKLNGDLTNNLTAGKIDIVPTNTTGNGEHGIFLSGRNYCYITGNVTNNISGGEMGVTLKANSIQSGIWFGLRSGGKITGNLTNHISGGKIYTVTEEGITAEYAAMHFGCFSGGAITGTMTNNISGGTFQVARGSVYFGQQGTSGYTGKIVNVLGDQATGNGPTFIVPGNIILAGGWGRIGASSNVSSLPDVSKTTDTVVVSNTIYGGTYGAPVIAGLNNVATKYVTFIQGSVHTDIYGGTFGAFYGNGDAPTYGHVSTNIYGGTFDAIYGNRKATVYDGVELNIYGMTEGEDPTGIWAAGTTPAVSAVTQGRDAVKLTIDPSDKLTLSMPISAGASAGGTVTGSTSVLVTGGTYTKGFAVEGVTVKAALAEGLVPLKDADNTVVTVTDTMTSTGSDSVTLVSGAWTEDTASLTLSDTTVLSDGKNDVKVPTATVKFENSTLVKDTDYTITYQRDGAATTDLTSLGTVTVVVTAKAPYSGTLTASYAIVRDDAVGKAIQALTEAVNAYDEDTVKSTDRDALTGLREDGNELLLDHADVLTEEEKSTLNGLLATIDSLIGKIDTVADQLADAKAAAAKIDGNTVNSDDSEALAALAAQLEAIPDSNLTDAEKAEKQGLVTKVETLQQILADTAADLKSLQEREAAFKTEELTSADKAGLEALLKDLENYPTEHLTAAEKQLLEQLAASVKDKLAVIEKAEQIAGDIGAIEKLLEGKTVETVTSEDKTDVQAALKAIEELKQDPDLSDADKQTLNALEEKAQALLDRIEAADKANDLSEDVADITAENVQLSQKDALLAAQEQLQEAEKTYGGNYTEAEKKANQDALDIIEKALAAISHVEALEEMIAQLPETAQPNDAEAAKALEEALAAYNALTDHEKSLVSQTALAAMAELAKALTDYKIDDGAQWTKGSGKALTLTVNGPAAKVTGVQVDGSTVDSKYYTLADGSVQLKEEFLETLDTGKHTVTVVYTDGQASGTFTVNPKPATPDTGDGTSLLLPALLALFSLTAAAALTITMKKRTH